MNFKLSSEFSKCTIVLVNFQWISSSSSSACCNWFLFKFELKATELNRCLFRFELTLKNNGMRQPDFCLNLHWKLLNWIVFYSDLNWKWKDIGLGQPWTESDWFVFKFQMKMKGNWSGATQDRIWLISIWSSIENKRKLVSGSPW